MFRNVDSRKKTPAESKIESFFSSKANRAGGEFNKNTGSDVADYQCKGAVTVSPLAITIEIPGYRNCVTPGCSSGARSRDPLPQPHPAAASDVKGQKVPAPAAQTHES